MASKFVDIICIKPDGKFELEKVKMIKTSSGLALGKGGCSQGPEFTRIQNGTFYSYVLEYNSGDSKITGTPNVYSNLFLNEECCCGYSDLWSERLVPWTRYSANCGHFNGNFYLSKHNPRLRDGNNFSFAKEISYEEFEKYDTTVNCTSEDLLL